MDQSRLAYLFTQYTNGNATPEEIAAFSEITADPAYQDQLTALIDQLFIQAPGKTQMPEAAIQAAVKAITGHTVDGEAIPLTSTSPRMPVIKYRWWAAAAIILLLGSAVYLLRPQTPAPVTQIPASDVAPGTDKAVLTLANGASIVLDSAGHQVIKQGNTAISQQGGQLQYNTQGTHTEVSFNTLTTPRGGQFRLTLPDGTKVWLNAASSLKYPTAFTGNNRTVELTGEAYFEVAKNTNMPFRVWGGNQLVEVLGTQFNINAYDNESGTKTTLLQGSVRVSLPAAAQQTATSVILKPGQQSAVSNANTIPVTTVSAADAVAWKNGLFQLDNANIADIMHQLERWYDIEVKYEGKIPDVHYTGGIKRSSPLSKVIAMLEATGDARFRIQKAVAPGSGEKDIVLVLK